MIRRLRNLLRGIPAHARTATAAPLPDLPPIKVETPSPKPCTPEDRCDTCRALDAITWPGRGER